MIVYNTTYTLPNEDARNFVIWVHESFLPKVEQHGTLSHPRLLRILSHHDQDTECYSLQFEVENTATLHNWYIQQGERINQEMLSLFENRVTGFSTIMESIEA